MYERYVDNILLKLKDSQFPCPTTCIFLWPPNLHPSSLCLYREFLSNPLKPRKTPKSLSLFVLLQKLLTFEILLYNYQILRYY